MQADETDLAVVVAQQDLQRAWRVLSEMVGKPSLSIARLEGNFDINRVILRTFCKG